MQKEVLRSNNRGGGELRDEESAGERRARLTQIYDRYHDTIYRYCLCRLFERTAAEDATSTVFLRLAERVDELDSNGDAPMRSWLYGTASNAVNIYLRAAKRRKEILRSVWQERRAGSSEDSGPGLERLDWPVLYEALLRLKPEYQDLVVLRFFQGLSPSRIAEILGMKPVAVRVRISRALKKLRQHLMDRCGR